MGSQHRGLIHPFNREAGPTWGLAPPTFRLDTKVCGDKIPSGSRRTSQSRKAQHYMDVLGPAAPSHDLHFH